MEDKQYLVKLGDDELHLLRMWFNSLLDTTENYLAITDYELAAKIHKTLGSDPPKRIVEYLSKEKSIEELLKAASEVTPREIWLQRVSFAYGNLMDSGVTKEQVTERAREVYGPCPEE